MTADRRKPETVLSAAIQAALASMGMMVERVQSGRYRVKGGWAYGAREGTPDLWTEAGWLEVKLPGEEPNEAQRLWHKTAQRRGVRVAVVRSVREAVEVVGGWRGEAKR